MKPLRSAEDRTFFWWSEGTSYLLLLPAAGPVLAQLLLPVYQQPGRDASGSHNGQTGAQTSPLDGPMRCCEVPTKFPFTGHLAAILAGHVLRVSAVARRAAAAYGDANQLPKKAKMPQFNTFPTCTKKTPRTKKMRI